MKKLVLMAAAIMLACSFFAPGPGFRFIAAMLIVIYAGLLLVEFILENEEKKEK